MTPTPPLPPEDADVAAVRAGIRIHPDEPTDVMVTLELDALAALDRLTKRAQEAERERDALRAWKTATHEQWAAWTHNDFKTRAEAAETREAALRDLLTRLRQWDMLNPAFGAGEPTADAPYWRSEIDRALAATANPGASK